VEEGGNLGTGSLSLSLFFLASCHHINPTNIKALHPQLAHKHLMAMELLSNSSNHLVT
jgi:hypothetical protein